MVAAMQQPAGTMRLARFLAHAGVASRRSAERLIAAGRVGVDGEIVRDPARGVGDANSVTVDGRPVGGPEPRVTFALHKPAGVVSTASDPQGRRTVVQLVDAGRRRLYPVGRLDADSSGLILLTNDGELANLVTHPRYEVAKTYRVKLAAPIAGGAVRALRAGVLLDDGPTAPAIVRRLSADAVEITIREGRNRQVRRMCAAVGAPVAALERVAFGPLTLEGLAPGSSRELTAAEVAALRSAAL
jgi:23S rRNA pseudouridine2605 synthase